MSSVIKPSVLLAFMRRPATGASRRHSLLNTIDKSAACNSTETIIARHQRCWTPAQAKRDPPENLLAGIIWREKGSCTQNRWFSTAKRLIEDKPHIDLRPNSLITCSQLDFLTSCYNRKAHLAKVFLVLTIEQVNLFGDKVDWLPASCNGRQLGRLHRRHWALRLAVLPHVSVDAIV